MPTIIVNIAPAGHPLNGGGTSLGGHMWFTLPNGTTLGYSPEGVISSDGATYAPGYLSYPINLTSEQWNNFQNFINDPGAFGFLRYGYDPFSHSCVDFVDEGLIAAGLVPNNYRGNTWPWSNRNPIDAIKSLFGMAESTMSPLVLDLDGDGIETTGVKAGAYFDHGGDGFAEQTGWVGKDDGLLVLDGNNNGIIDDGKELFGDNTLLATGQKADNGFAALAELDTNHDGKIDAADPNFSQLKVLKGDGTMLTLSDAGVQSINVAYTSENIIDAQGNQHFQAGTFTRTDGTTAQLEDVWFAVDQTHSIATQWLDVPDEIAALPDAKGYGQVYDLHQAMVRDQSGALKSLVSQFVAAGSVSERNTLVEQIVYKWAGVDTIDPNSRGRFIDARKVYSLEVFLGPVNTI
jgi:hypothetical protein